MIRFRKIGLSGKFIFVSLSDLGKMRYYDIHTHYRQEAPSVVAIVNMILGEERPGIGYGEMFEASTLYSVGIHPWYIHTEVIEEQLVSLRDLAGREEIFMIGEAGLDKQVVTPLAIQEAVFEAQICLSEALRKPLVIHCVKAWDELLSVRKRLRPAMPWIVHGFRKKGDLAKQLLRQGFYLSFGVSFQESALREAWPDRLLLETDESDCSIWEIYERAAEALSLPLDEVGRQVERNFRVIFNTNACVFI